ncbi:MAG TPA: FAD:protein FMN transferase [Kofleriaceae bacterium]|nr:FAD:protein FMN transferase [Kofleriaceae bacterium]
MRDPRLALVALACAVLVRTASAAPGKIKYTDTAMGTYVTVWFFTDNEEGASKAAADVFAEMRRLDALMTNFNNTSEIGRINAAAGDHPVEVSDETLLVLDRAIDVSKRSGGVFDITVGAFKGLWKFDEDMDADCKAGKPSCKLPDPADVKRRLALVNWKDLVIDHKKKTVFLRHKGMAITLGGIAKGYAVDKCVAILKKDGFADFMVQAGGDMYVAGKKGDEPWQVGIRDPRGPSDALFAGMPITDHSFSTSGDYERGFVKDGVRYHHIIDPRTGNPARASRSVTIRARDAFTADAWSKVMFIYGWKAGMDIIKREHLDDFEVVWVDDKNDVHMTPGIAKELRIVKQPTDGP